MNTEFKFGAIREKKVTKGKLESTLGEWIHYLFPYETAIFDFGIPTNIWEMRSKCRVEYRKYRPDVRIESLNLVIEYDGMFHYTNAQTVSIDEERDFILGLLGYRVVRIPYFVQLTSDVIKHYFDLEVEQGSKVSCGFHSMTSDPYHLNPYCPANYCPAGVNRFVRQVSLLPESAKEEIFNSLEIQCKKNPRNYVLPIEIHYDALYDLYNDFYKRVAR